MTRRFVIAAVAAATAVQQAAAEIACNSGFVEFTCPDTHPICCSWPQNHVVAACCPADSVCALNEGRCLIMPGHSPNATQANDQGGVTVGVSEAAAFITFAAIGFIVALVGCSFLGFKMFLVAEGHRQRRQEAERQALLAGSDDDGEQGDGDGESSSEPDDEGQCNICYSHHINCVLMPCAHVATCRMCAGRLEKCPICREDVSKFIPLKTRIFTSKQTTTGGKRTGKGSAGQEVPTSARSLELQESARVPAAAAASAGSRAASARQAVEEADTDERPTVVADATVNAAAADTVSVDNDNGSSAAAVEDVAAPADEDEHVAASEEVSPRGASTVE